MNKAESFKNSFLSTNCDKFSLKTWILRLLKDVSFETVTKMADSIRREIHGDTVHLRAIIEFSNYCKCNCLFCGIRRENRKLSRYRMSEEEIVKVAKEAAEEGFKTIVLQSGEDPFWNAERLSKVVREIKKLNVAVTLSVGELSYDEYAVLREAGADRYLLKFETSDEKLFKRLKPDTTLDRRIQCLRWLKELGYETGSGIIVGLPGQSLESLAADIALMKELELDMAGIGPFIPHPETPLGIYPVGDVFLTLKILAITRILLPRANMPATTALGSLSPDLRLKAFYCGANVIMPDVTPERYKNLYEIYPGKNQSKSSYSYWKNVFKNVGRKVL
ncbi:[FeFe] hydrogenase H-cluster radical SAM maturase HydE [Thermodesulfovibrio yellowstonii]|uniref:[FeFe] hydrogenase H-cluster radical SAM maturase HydE n=1 Tax=Thermodesulfovibrio yellowstonii TaxID=28262 RepID=A0A9W6GCY1_9BACT|nr:[FeFe] hydrogenase H-cluster radical SAM maturase HydE [Thermodesulfovibrio islandicus]GLI52914.1 [FeFe] hydrogenase H-cluster radical SAM maturase HydE [Thermodesulfovibrio islandicus]